MYVSVVTKIVLRSMLTKANIIGLVQPNDADCSASRLVHVSPCSSGAENLMPAKARRQSQRKWRRKKIKNKNESMISFHDQSLLLSSELGISVYESC